MNVGDVIIVKIVDPEVVYSPSDPEVIDIVGPGFDVVGRIIHTSPSPTALPEPEEEDAVVEFTSKTDHPYVAQKYGNSWQVVGDTSIWSWDRMVQHYGVKNYVSLR